MSAIRSDENEPIQVLFTMHDNMNLLDFAGPLEVLTHAQLDVSKPGNIPSTSPDHTTTQKDTLH